MTRDLKRQILRDNQQVFHNPKGFSEKMRLKYQGRDMEIWAQMQEEGTAVRDKNNNQRKNDNERMLYQYDKYLWVNREDFGCIPKKERKIQVNGILYIIREVSHEFGEIMMTLRRLDE